MQFWKQHYTIQHTTFIQILKKNLKDMSRMLARLKNTVENNESNRENSIMRSPDDVAPAKFNFDVDVVRWNKHPIILGSERIPNEQQQHR